MELVIVAVIIVASVLGVSGFIFAYLLVKITLKSHNIYQEVQKITEEITNDQYTPTYSKDEVPLVDFTPNFKEPLKVKFEEEDRITPDA